MKIMQKIHKNFTDKDPDLERPAGRILIQKDPRAGSGSGSEMTLCCGSKTIISLVGHFGSGSY